MLDIEVRKLKDGENLESLILGELVNIIDSFPYTDNNHIGLYIGRKDGRFIFLTRGLETRDSIARWSLSGKGYINPNGGFTFDSLEELEEGNEDYVIIIGVTHPDYQTYDQRLEERRL